ncbi:hypothetical protein JTB14_025672 [Gonioctena quinquepunctata]|nr:hypothetical protein JTB14_025672 [Gonioctena quinquepunctata]
MELEPGELQLMNVFDKTSSGIEDNILRPTNIRVTMSQHDLMQKNTDAYQMDVIAITVHPGYICSKPKDDIALLELGRNIQWSESVLPACLPIASSSNSELDNLLATVAGWGWTHEDSSKGSRANNLQKARVNIIENDECRTWYQSQGKKTKIQDSHICAGHKNGGRDSCWADSGGPLMVDTDERSNQMMVVGVVSTGIGCARPYLPGLYTRVSDYIPWIRQVIGK